MGQTFTISLTGGFGRLRGGEQHPLGPNVEHKNFLYSGILATVHDQVVGCDGHGKGNNDNDATNSNEDGTTLFSGSAR